MTAAPTGGRLVRTTCAAVGLCLVVAGCGAGATDQADEGTSDPASASPGSPEEQPSETEPTETTPAVDPATGPAIGVKGLEVRAPEGWITTEPLAIQQSAGPPDVIGSMISVFRFPNSGLFTVDELGDEEVSDMGARSRRRDDVELDGEQFYHLTGTLEPGLYAERFGTIAGDDRLSVQFEFGNGQGRAERDEIIQSVLATVQVG
jgi:hypothetical protein